MNTQATPISTCAKCLEDFDTDELSVEMNCPKCAEQGLEKITSLFFEGRQYTTNEGTTFQSVRVLANGRLLGAVEYAFGYGSQFEWYAIEFLEANGLLEPAEGYYPRSYLREKGVTLYTALSHTPKKEMFKAEQVLENIALFETI